MKESSVPDVELSVIIPTLNRGKVLYETIRQVLAQQGCTFELIIVDQSDESIASENVKFLEEVRDPRVKYIAEPEKNLPNARNVGVRNASADIIVFLDDDVILLREEFLRAHARAYADDNVGGATGRSVERLLQPNSRHTSCHVSLGGRTIFNLMGLSQQTIGTCKGSNMSFRTAVFEKVGGFDRRTELLEDADFSVRVRKAGWSLLFLPDAELLHLSANSGGVRSGGALQTERRRFRYTAYFILKHRGVTGLLPFLFTFGLIACVRTWRFRSFGVFFALLSEIGSGYGMWRKGSDQALITKRV
jgi:GT2 family glycosyltransferase